MASNLQSDLDELKQFFIDLLKDNPDGILKHTIWWELQEKSGHAILPQQYNIGLTKDAKKTVFSLWNDDIEEINSKDGPILRLRKRAKSEPLTAGELADANLVHEEARIMAANKEDEHRLLRDTIAVDGDSTSVTTTTQLPEAMDGSGAARTGVQGSKQTPEDKMQPLLTIPPPIMPIRGRLFALPNQKPMAPNPTSNMFVQLHPLLGCALNIPRFNQPMPLLNLQQPPTGQVTANQYGQRMHYPRYITMPQTFNQARQSATFLQQPPPNRLPQDIMKQSLNLPKTSQANLTYNTAIGMTNVGITTHQAPSRKECQDADKQTASAPVRDRKSSTENVNSTSAATMVEKKEFVNEDIYVKPVFIPKGQAPSNTVVEGIAKECIELLADHNEFVTSDRVKELLLRRFGVASVRNLGYNTIDHVPCVFELNRMVCKINEYIMAFIKTRSMFTLYEFRECLREFVPNKEDFSQLKLGPLQRFPEIYRHFKFPPDQEEIPEITSMELLDHLDRYLTLNNRWTSRLEIEDFMNYLVAEYSADNAYYLGVKIKSLPLALQVLKKAKRDAGARRREILEHFYTSLRSDIEDAFRRFRTSVLQSGDDGMEVRRHYLKIKADDAIMEIFEKFKLLQMIEQPTTHAEQRALLKFTNAFGEFMKLVQQNKTCKMLFHLAICISSTSLQECAMDFLTSPSTSQPAPVEETPTQPRPNKANLVRAFREYVDGCLAAGSQLNLQNLRKIEEKLAEGFKFPSFHDMGYGSFLHFLLREGKQVLEESGGDLIGAHMAGSTSDTAFKPHQDDIVKFIRQGRECGVTQPLQLEEALCSQYGVKDFRQLGHGHFGHLLKLASPTQLSPEFTVVYETTLVARSGVSLVKTDKVGILGDQTLHNAKVCLHNCPLLTDLADWSQWGPVFEPQHGKLKGFIQRYGGVTTHMEDGKIVTFDIVAMETKPGHLIKITGNTSAEQFTAALVVGDVTGVCGHLVSLTVSSKGVADLPAALLSSHMTTTLHQMHAVDEEFTPGAPQILGGTHSQAVQFVLSCLVKMPIRTCIALTNQIFLEPLGKVVGCTRSKQELLRACSSVTERTRLLELGYTLGVSEWTGSLDARCELPESAVETIPLSEMEDFFDMEDEEKAESVISYESQEELESSFSDVESVELVDEDGKPTESSTAESLVDECLDTVSAAASGDAEAKIDDGTILDVAPVGTDTDTSTGDEVNSCLNIVNQIRREEFGIGVDLNEDGQKLMKGLTGMAAGGYNAVVDDWRSSYDLNSLHASGEHSSHIQVLKKKPQTLQVWLEDFEWACGRTPESSKSPEDGKMETNEVNCAVTPASSKSSEDGKMGNDEATCGRIPELSKSSEDEKIETDKATYGWTPESSKSPEDGKMETNEVNCAVTLASSKSSEDGKMGNDEATCGRIPELSKSSEDEKIETDKATYGWTPESSKSPEDGKMETNEVNCAVTPASSKSSEDGKMEIDKATCAVTVTPASSNSPEDGKMGNDEDTCGRIPELSKSSEDEKIETDEATYGWTPESSKSPEDGRMETIEDTCAVTHESSNLLEEQIIFVSESVFDDTDGDGDYVPDSSQSGNDDDDECELPFSVITSLAVVPELSTSSEDGKIETDEATCGRIPESSKSRVDGKTETNEDTCAVTHESSNLLEEQIIFGSESEFDNTDRDSDYVPDFSQLGNDDDEYELPVSVIKSLAVVRELSTSSEDEKIETDEATCGRTPESSKSPDDGRMETNKAKCAVTPESSKSPENGKMEINKVTCAVTPESSNLMETDQAASVLASEPANSSEDEVTESNEAGQCCHNGLDDALKDIDEEYPDIYIRSNIKSKFSTTGRAKASDRVYNNYHCCFLCKKLSTNINKHFRSHKDNPETMEIIQLRGQIKEGNKKDIEKELKTRQALLRHKGDHFHNMLVKRKKKGELIISRKTGKFKVEEYGPCPKCLEWMRMESYRVNHQNICPGVDNVCIKMKKGEAINNSAVICGDVDERASKQLITEVYPVMTRDSVTTCAKEDSLIVALGNSWLRRSLGNVLKRKYYTSSRMRGAARLLQHLRNLSKTNNTMSDFLLPKYFDLVCEAALLCAKIENDDEEDLKSPSAALKIGFDVSRMTSFKLGLALRDGDKEQKAESEEFNTLMKMEWSTRVSRLAHLQLRKDQLEGSNIAALPVPEDLATLGTQIVTELKNMNYKKKDIESYRRVVMLTETRLLTYNKRRSGELEALTLQNYRTRAIELDEADRGLLGNDLTDLEMYLIKSQELIKIRGKNGKTVPVLVPGDCKRGLAFIAEDGIRKAVGVKTWNPYLFANTGDSVMRAYDSLKTISAELSLAAPERITSVSLRKYIATLSQVIDMKDHELEWLCNHLGHTASIHKLHYRSTSGFIERVNIGKLMILQDMNLAGKYAGQRLQDIDISEFVNTKQAADTPDAAGDGSASGGEPEGAIGFENPKPENWNEYDDDIEFVPKKRRTSTRQPWNSVEEDELRKLFVENFKESKKPGIKDCNRAIAKSRATNGQIHKRCWETIKKKMIRMMKETN